MQDKAISNEVLARIYGAYLGSPIIYSSTIYNKPLQRGKLLSVCSYTLEILIGRDETDNDMSTIGNSRLELLPLSDITDEHCKEVAKILLPLYFANTSILDWKVSRDFTITNFPYIKVWHQKKVHSVQIDPTLRNFDIDGMEDRETGQHDMRPSEITDYLRQQGYDLGYGSLASLIDSGIAVKKDQK